ncbi:SF-assemblin/beta giardin protein [Toxoplasma gondii RUB]|uniref:SF-assemblin/beta giardin protein n=13 Tax=Toxoplasma gondii TaxID=5811 RepID=A0A125YUP1_TOXGV|nr:SF-assemblin/beta giardin protein [Toxoplasma gondii GT1]ESS28348.1 SF-assemblin/beta giardin protein [Toxoplasma gondii VEG]KAF4638148.1 SF-assemblin/beta giardin protein [Toxoplasma gondii]KFG28718.1 SF-assemblin/beta giardin protein [Toxoplasma gondii p89]KFG32957.1 SF-assemblin/beta giardin protein [Toxoplasma gondii FOU]KFG47863.1 SF-assemblin/beta giardin protein [Toxoplasma gondii GAB2-2007-GAL-DOM2]KFG56831.1 SF-assemblin/beta giardin protein [Toxoplasma gondii RUB]KFH02021.1 SF-a
MAYAGQSTRSKLAVLSERIHGFEKQMECEAKQRREGEEGRLLAIREAITKLEKTLNAEIKRRVEANKALQAMFESQLLGVQDKLSSVFVEKFEQLQCALDALNDRLAVVEREFTVEREKQTKEWEEKTELLGRDMAAIQNAREQKYDQVREELEEAKRVRERGEEKFQTFVLEEVAALKNGLILESQVSYRCSRNSSPIATF